MIRSIGLYGPLTLETVNQQLALIDPVQTGEHIQADLSSLQVIDSAAVALLLAWQRKVRATNAHLALVNIPEHLQRLIAVYGLTELLLVD